LSKIDPRAIARAKSVVRERFPEMAGVEPTVSTRGAVSKGGAGATHVLTFRKDVPLPDGKHLARLVRVTIDARGEIVKLASSK
jgi:hypothetical protein